MQIKEQFNKYANTYSNYSRVQQLGVEYLVNKLPKSLGVVADIGCGDGRVYTNIKSKNIDFKEFYAVDFAKNMLKKHQKSSNIYEIVGDFNTKELFLELEKKRLDTIVSASAIQWAESLDFTIHMCSKVAKMGYFFIFTSGTFKGIHSFLNVESPIHRQEAVIKSFSNYYKATKVEPINFKLEFSSNKEMLLYIKRSGVSGGVNVGYKKLKELITNHQKAELEFEALILVGESLAKV